MNVVIREDQETSFFELSFSIRTVLILGLSGPFFLPIYIFYDSIRFNAALFTTEWLKAGFISVLIFFALSLVVINYDELRRKKKKIASHLNVLLVTLKELESRLFRFFYILFFSIDETVIRDAGERLRESAECFHLLSDKDVTLLIEDFFAVSMIHELKVKCGDKRIIELCKTIAKQREFSELDASEYEEVVERLGEFIRKIEDMMSES